jgi:cellulose synthase/poly-beta-1,6-N-acetylglucosamine synthase-like glycosyltransferase
MQPGLTISVVICTYTSERWPELRAAVESVRSQSLLADELIVVVDHNDELHRRVASDLAVDRVVDSASVRGLSGARNTGVEVARGDVVAFLDDDAVADPDWLRKLTAPYARSEVIGVGGRVLPNWADSQPSWFPAEFGWVVGCSYEGQPTHLAEVRNPIGANMSFRRQPLVDVGGFAPTVGRVGTRPMGCEETEASIRLTRNNPGAVILYEPAAVVHHLVPISRCGWAYFRRRCWAEGLSKAEVSRLAGRRPALAAEKHYVSRTVPQGISREVKARDTDGLRRAAAMLAGVTATSAGYAAGRVRSAVGHRRHRRDTELPIASRKEHRHDPPRRA